MYFLIDYENVNYAGLEGTEFLEKQDTIAFFFSANSNKNSGYRMMDIERSGCTFEICKLKNIRKNALDFYIASKIGEIFAMDRNATVAIISADKDYQSVLDYWKPRLMNKQLVRCKTIAKAMSYACEESNRKADVDRKMQLLDLQTEFAKYEERKRIEAGITDLFTGTDYEKLILSIVDVVFISDRPKVLYLNSIKLLGKKAGTEVYRKIKDCDLINYETLGVV